MKAGPRLSRSAFGLFALMQRFHAYSGLGSRAWKGAKQTPISQRSAATARKGTVAARVMQQTLISGVARGWHPGKISARKATTPYLPRWRTGSNQKPCT